jgi:hypothetical protein
MYIEFQYAESPHFFTLFKRQQLEWKFLRPTKQEVAEKLLDHHLDVQDEDELLIGEDKSIAAIQYLDFKSIPPPQYLPENGSSGGQGSVQPWQQIKC